MTSVYKIEERALLNEFKSGDRIAFDRIFEQYNPALVFFANRYLINFDQSNAKDLVLESFLKLYDRRESFASLASIKAFLYITVKNSCLSFIEKEKVRLKRFDRFTQDFDESEDSVLSRIVHAEVLQELYAAIDMLPDQYRLIMHKIIDGKTAKEISQELNMPVNTVNTQKSRAISLLKNKLSGAGIALLLFYF